MTKPELEICAGDLRSIRAAVLGGADRVEICSALPLGGLTPQASSLLLSEPFADRLRRHVLLRPRPGDFLYTEDEMLCMEADLSEPSLARADGFVIGVLRSDGSVDIERTSRLMRRGAAFGAKSFTFHRAFDMTADPFRALEDIIALGFDRVLTSGCAPSAEQGMEMLRCLNEQAAGRITIMAGGSRLYQPREPAPDCRRDRHHEFPCLMQRQDSERNVVPQRRDTHGCRKRRRIFINIIRPHARGTTRRGGALTLTRHFCSYHDKQTDTYRNSRRIAALFRIRRNIRRPGGAFPQ